MAGALRESKRGTLGDGGQTGEQQASNRVVPPEHAEEEQRKPERGLTSEFRGDARLNRAASYGHANNKSNYFQLRSSLR